MALTKAQQIKMNSQAREVKRRYEEGKRTLSSMYSSNMYSEVMCT